MQGILFDLDGTLLNTLTDIAASMNRVLAQNSLPTHPERAYCYMVGNGAKLLARRAVGEHTEAYETVYAAYCAEYTAHALDHAQPYPGIPELLRALPGMGLVPAVLSNKPDGDTQAIIRHFFPHIPFGVVQGQLEGVAIKPDPAGALSVAARLGIRPADMWYAGDTSVDMACAKNAGMVSIGVTWGFRPRQELADAGALHIVDSTAELLRLLGGSARSQNTVQIQK